MTKSLYVKRNATQIVVIMPQSHLIFIETSLIQKISCGEVSKIQKLIK